MSSSKQSWADWAKEKAPGAAALGMMGYGAGTSALINRGSRAHGYGNVPRTGLGWTRALGTAGGRTALRALPMPLKLAAGVGTAGLAATGWAARKGDQ